MSTSPERTATLKTRLEANGVYGPGRSLVQRLFMIGLCAGAFWFLAWLGDQKEAAEEHAKQRYQLAGEFTPTSDDPQGLQNAFTALKGQTYATREELADALKAQMRLDLHVAVPDGTDTSASSKPRTIPAYQRKQELYEEHERRIAELARMAEAAVNAGAGSGKAPAGTAASSGRTPKDEIEAINSAREFADAKLTQGLASVDAEVERQVQRAFRSIAPRLKADGSTTSLVQDNCELPDGPRHPVDRIFDEKDSSYVVYQVLWYSAFLVGLLSAAYLILSLLALLPLPDAVEKFRKRVDTMADREPGQAVTGAAKGLIAAAGAIGLGAAVVAGGANTNANEALKHVAAIEHNSTTLQQRSNNPTNVGPGPVVDPNVQPKWAETLVNTVGDMNAALGIRRGDDTVSDRFTKLESKVRDVPENVGKIAGGLQTLKGAIGIPEAGQTPASDSLIERANRLEDALGTRPQGQLPVVNLVDTIAKSIGAQGNPNRATLFGQLDDLNATVTPLPARITNLQSAVGTAGTKQRETLFGKIGEVTDSPSDNTVHGKLNQIDRGVDAAGVSAARAAEDVSALYTKPRHGLGAFLSGLVGREQYRVSPYAARDVANQGLEANQTIANLVAEALQSMMARKEWSGSQRRDQFEKNFVLALSYVIEQHKGKDITVGDDTQHAAQRIYDFYEKEILASVRGTR